MTIKLKTEKIVVRFISHLLEFYAYIFGRKHIQLFISKIKKEE